MWRRLAGGRTTVRGLVGAGLAAALLAAGCGAPTAPFKDADNGGPNDHGWFQAGMVWRGDLGDPTVVRVGGVYYAYSSPTGGRYLPVLTSTDLTTWRIRTQYSTNGPPGRPGYSVATDPAIPAEIRASADNDWGKYNNQDGLVRPASWGLTDVQGPWLRRDLWAPGVFAIGSTYYAYSAVRVGWASDDPNHYGRFCLTVASSASPAGPFRDISGGAPIQCQPATHDPAGSIDPSPYHDPATGRNYLLWKAAGMIGVRESALMAVELGADGKPKAGAPWQNLLETNRAAPWEGGTIENPSMISYGGTTYLFYSANNSRSDSTGHSNYATGYAICPSGPLAPCFRPDPAHPLLASNGTDQGPGGASTFTDTAGGLRLSYATYWGGETRPDHPRRLHITQLVRGAYATLRVG